MQGPILELIKSYLKDRIQRVFVSNTISNHAKCFLSEFFRALFLQLYCFRFMSTIFINVLMPYQLYMQMILYVYSNIKICKSQLLNWYSLNKLCLKVDKTKVLVFLWMIKSNNFPTLGLIGIERKKVSKLSFFFKHSNVRCPFWSKFNLL